MISYIKGTLERRAESYIIIETGGIGYRIFVSPATLAKLPQTGAEAKVYTYFSVKEDGMSLYGFSSVEEQEMFNKLLTVSGVGPKGALGFLSVMKPSEIVMAILSDDVKTLSKAPGVGRKTANLVVGDVYGKPAVVTDTHFIRIVNRLGLTEKSEPFSVEKELRSLLDPDESNDFCHRTVLHGRAVCTARRAFCEKCVLSEICKKVNVK